MKPVQCSVVKLQRRRRARVNIGPAGDSAQCSQSHESQLRVPAAPVVAPVTSNQPIKCSSLTFCGSNCVSATTTRLLRTTASATNASLRTNLQPVPKHLLKVLFALDLNRAGDVPPTAAAAAHQSSSSSSYIGQMAGSSNETGPFFDVISSTIVDSYGCTHTCSYNVLCSSVLGIGSGWHCLI